MQKNQQKKNNQIKGNVSRSIQRKKYCTKPKSYRHKVKSFDNEKTSLDNLHVCLCLYIYSNKWNKVATHIIWSGVVTLELKHHYDIVRFRAIKLS